MTLQQHVFELHTPLICGFFSINTKILHDLQLAESTDAKPQIWKIDYKVIHRFSTAQDRDRQEISAQKLCIVQGPTAHTNENT